MNVMSFELGNPSDQFNSLFVKARTSIHVNCCHDCN